MEALWNECLALRHEAAIVGSQNRDPFKFHRASRLTGTELLPDSVLFFGCRLDDITRAPVRAIRKDVYLQA